MTTTDTVSIANQYLALADEYKVTIDVLTQDFIAKIDTLRKSAAKEIEQDFRDQEVAVVERLLENELASD